MWYKLGDSTEAVRVLNAHTTRRWRGAVIGPQTCNTLLQDLARDDRLRPAMSVWRTTRYMWLSPSTRSHTALMAAAARSGDRRLLANLWESLARMQHRSGGYRTIPLRAYHRMLNAAARNRQGRIVTMIVRRLLRESGMAIAVASDGKLPAPSTHLKMTIRSWRCIFGALARTNLFRQVFLLLEKTAKPLAFPESVYAAVISNTIDPKLVSVAVGLRFLTLSLSLGVCRALMYVMWCCGDVVMTV